MKALLVEALPWALSLVTVIVMWMAGSNWRWTWALALVGQALWLVWIFAAEAWGLLPMNAVLWWIYLRNHMRWKYAP